MVRHMVMIYVFRMFTIILAAEIILHVHLEFTHDATDYLCTNIPLDAYPCNLSILLISNNTPLCKHSINDLFQYYLCLNSLNTYIKCYFTLYKKQPIPSDRLLTLHPWFNYTCILLLQIKNSSSVL